MKIAWVFIGLGMLMVFLYLFPAFSGIFDALQESENMTWGVSANAMENLSPTSHALAGSWKYLFLMIGVGGILYLIFRVMKGDSNE